MALGTYTALQSAVAAYLARDGDADITSRIDDFIALCEQRMYIGKVAVPALQLPEHEAVRIPQMEITNATFALAATVAQPGDFLELISADNNNPYGPMTVVDEGVISSHYRQSPGGPPSEIAVSGTNFRVWGDPGTTNTATLRYYGKLATPTSMGSANWILANAPGVYLNGCLLEASIFTGALDEAKLYAALYAADVGGLNQNRNRQAWSARNMKVRLRGPTP